MSENEIETEVFVTKWSDLDINQKITFKNICTNKRARRYVGVNCDHKFFDCLYLLAYINRSWEQSFEMFLSK